ncbi:S9 family peptidase [Shewanella sp. WXL01]|uniref:alpha/beta hydrolase family protein n=1 Tax=Shewanella sp. WXL01 TaxID=2709721 RepID=UPI001FDAAE94|nr:S9 family peptidase [Shewanella sp. WXL01]
MKRNFLGLLAAIASTVMCAYHTQIAHAEQPTSNQTVQQLPAEAFGSLPDVSNVRLSPDGNHIAFVQRLDGKEPGSVISIFNVADKSQIYPIRTDNKRFRITNLTWANNDILLVKANFPATRYGTPVTESRLVKYSLTEKKMSNVLKKSVMKRFKWIPQFQSNVIDYLPEDDEHILMQFRGMGNTPEYPSVMKVNLAGGRSHWVQPSRRDVWDWITDRQHTVRIGIYRDDTAYRIYEQSENKGDMRVLWEFEAFEENVIWPVGFDHDPNILYVNSYVDGYKALSKVDLRDPELKLELVFSRDGRDVNPSLVYSRAKKKVVGFTDGDDSDYTFWDNDLTKLANGLDKALPDFNNEIISLSDDNRRYILLTTNQTESGTFFFGDRDTQDLAPFAYRYQALPPELMAETNSHFYKARDGQEIQAFLTTPKNIEAKNLPLIVHPHGGPISFSNGGFDNWSQFFANQGYAVLQMNFRGSAGYGFDFMKAGIAKWGQQMQTDVEDATRWAIEQGIADPKRICIVGASYGGYAALMEVATTNNLYQCAVSFGGVMDVEDLVKNHRNYTSYDIVKKQIGDDFDVLYENSPVYHAKNVNVPVLLIHGEKDRVVRVDHSEDMYDALKKHNKDVEYIELKNGTHYLTNNKNRVATFKAMERFLAENLKSTTQL